MRADCIGHFNSKIGMALSCFINENGDVRCYVRSCLEKKGHDNDPLHPPVNTLPDGIHEARFCVLQKGCGHDSIVPQDLNGRSYGSGRFAGAIRPASVK